MKERETYYLDDNLEDEWTEELEKTMKELKNTLDLPTEEVEKTLDKRIRTERRQSKRIEIHVPILTTNGNRITEAFTVDMNFSGCFIETEAPFRVGDKIQVSLETNLGGIGGLLHGLVETDLIDAVVRWHRPKASQPDEYVGMGVEFMNVTQAQKKQIERILMLSETETLLSP